MDSKTLEILQQRALRYGKPLDTRSTNPALGTFVGCRIGEIHLGLPSEMVHEFAPLSHYTPFRGRKSLVGLTHLRGDVMSLLDLLEAVTGNATGKCQWMVVLQGLGGRVAAPVNSILGIRIVEMAELLPQDQNPIASPLVMAATNDLWFLLDEQKLQSAFE